MGRSLYAGPNCEYCQEPNEDGVFVGCSRCQESLQKFDAFMGTLGEDREIVQGSYSTVAKRLRNYKFPESSPYGTGSKIYSADQCREILLSRQGGVSDYVFERGLMACYLFGLCLYDN